MVSGAPEENRDFKKERLEDRTVQKFQENVDEKVKQLERVIKDLQERVYKLENP